MLSKKEFIIGGLYTAMIALGIMAITGFYKKSMNVLRIIEHPDPILRKVSEPVTHIDDSIISLTEDIIATLRYQTMVDFFVERSVPRGLAAPQVGISKRLVVCGLNGKIRVMINPEILERKGVYLDTDDCMSVHEDKNTVIKRSAYVKVRYYTLENEEKILELQDDNAALLEHEIDHLNGVLNIDH